MSLCVTCVAVLPLPGVSRVALRNVCRCVLSVACCVCSVASVPLRAVCAVRVQSVLFVLASCFVLSGAMALPMTSFPNMNSLCVEDDFGQPYLSMRDFLLHGSVVSLLAYALVVSFAYGLIHALL